MYEVLGLLDGRWMASATGRWLERRDPADEERLVSRCPAMSAEEARAAVGAAAAALPAWRGARPDERGEVLRTAARHLHSAQDELVDHVVAESGKTRREAVGEVVRTAEILDYYAGMDRVPTSYLAPERRPDVATEVRREPLGVVVAITPWNDPLLTPVRKLAPALLAGNTVVLKPAEQTPLSSFHLCRALQDAGLPPGVLGLVTGRGDEVGAALVADDRVDGVTFTGSTAVGHALAHTVAGRPVRLQAEMGGKNALVVLGDADLDAVVDAVVFAGFGQAGQRCTATSRLLVHHAVSGDLVERLTAAAERLHVGPGRDEASDVGALVDRKALEAVLARIDEAREDGARVRTGGRALDDGPLARGCFCAPTVLDRVDPAMRIWDTEVFGPVVGITTVASLDDAIAKTNASRYGLAASIFTRDRAAAARFAAEAQVGNVAVNLPTVGWDLNVPFGGVKASGSGFKEQGVEAFAFSTRTRAVALNEAAFRSAK